jgi:hypothetical protein
MLGKRLGEILKDIQNVQEMFEGHVKSRKNVARVPRGIWVQFALAADCLGTLWG